MQAVDEKCQQGRQAFLDVTSKQRNSQISVDSCQKKSVSSNSLSAYHSSIKLFSKPRRSHTFFRSDSPLVQKKAEMDSHRNDKPARKKSITPERRRMEFLLERPSQPMMTGENGPRVMPEPEKLILPPILTMGNSRAIIRDNAEQSINMAENKLQSNNSPQIKKSSLPPLSTNKYLTPLFPGPMKFRPMRRPSKVRSVKPEPLRVTEPHLFYYADDDEFAHVSFPRKRRDEMAVFRRDYSRTSFRIDEPVRLKNPVCGRRLYDGKLAQPKIQSIHVNPYVEQKPEVRAENIVKVASIDKVRPVSAKAIKETRKHRKPPLLNRNYSRLRALSLSGSAILEAKSESSVPLVSSVVVVDNSALKVANLQADVGYDELLSLFPKASSITYPVYDREGPANLKPIRFCYVLFDDVEHAHAALVKMDGTEVNGKTLNLDYRRYNTTS